MIKFIYRIIMIKFIYRNIIFYNIQMNKMLDLMCDITYSQIWGTTFGYLKLVARVVGSFLDLSR